MLRPQIVPPIDQPAEQTVDRRMIDRLVAVVVEQILLADIGDVARLGILGEQMIERLILARPDRLRGSIRTIPRCWRRPDRRRRSRRENRTCGAAPRRRSRKRAVATGGIGTPAFGHDRSWGSGTRHGHNVGFLRHRTSARLVRCRSSALEAPPSTRPQGGPADAERCQSGRLGRSRKPLCRKVPWVRIPPSPPVSAILTLSRRRAGVLHCERSQLALSSR